jgi:hypothetical protein
MPIHIHLETIPTHAHPCPPMNNNIEPMPTTKSMCMGGFGHGDGYGTQCRALLHTRDWEPVTMTLWALSLVEKAELVQVRFTLRLRDQRSMWIHDGCEVYVDSYMASNRYVFMVTWTIFKNHLMEAGITQNRETMAHRMLTIVYLIYFYHVWGLTWIEIHWSSIWLRVWSHMTSRYTWGSMITLHDVGGVLAGINRNSLK